MIGDRKDQVMKEDELKRQVLTGPKLSRWLSGKESACNAGDSS